MNRIVLIAFFVFSAISHVSDAQPSTCINADFELNSFAGWSGSTGWCCPVTTTVPGFVFGRHTIMTGNGTDPNTNNMLSVVAPGGSYSVRLGNDNFGSEAEQLRYSFLVTPQTQMFLYRYAVVLEDPSHSILDQPRFEIKVFDQNGTVDTTCGVYEVYAAAGIPGFQTVTGPFGTTIHWKDWTTVGIDLSSKMGSTITIEFSTGDCALGAHFGYAYIDCICYPFDVLSDFCPGNFTATLTAPQGFATYQWSTGETTRAITITNPIIGDTFTVTMTSVTGCDVTLNSIIRETLVASAYSLSDSCYNAAHFIDSSYIITGSPITNWDWSFGDGATSNDQNPTHIYPGPGTYNATLIVTNQGGCKDTVVQVVNVKDIPHAGFTTVPVCPGDTTFFTDTTFTATSGITSWQWDFGDGTISSGIQHPNHIYNVPGTYNVTLIAEDAFGCIDSTVVPVTTEFAAVTSFGYSTDCITTDVSFTDSSAVSGGNITSWTWYFGDGTTSDQQNPLHTYAGPGTYTVSLVTVVNNACSDSASRNITLLDVPVAVFSTDNECSGATTAFTDSSFLPGSSITAWSWSFGDGGISSDQHPLHQYNSPGTYNVLLTVTGANGCIDTTSAPVTVLNSPVADFTYLPNCPGQAMQFNDATSFPSPSNNAWIWNFGDFSAPDITENPLHIYNSSGPFNVTLIVTDDNGCADTVTKPVVTSVAPVAGFIPPLGCPGLPVAFQSQSSVSAGTIDTTIWDFGDGTLPVTGVNVNHIFSTYGGFNVTLTAISNTGCRDVFIQEVNIAPPPVANFTANVVCVGNPTTFGDLTMPIPSPIVSWIWNFGDGSPVFSGQNPQHVYNTDSLQTVTLVVMNASGCVDTGQKIINVNALPIVDFSTTSPQCEGNSIQFFNHVMAPSGIQRLQWDYGDGTPLSPGANPVHIYTVPANYAVELIATDNNGCTDSTSKVIQVLPVPAVQFAVQTACLNQSNACSDNSSLAGGNIAGWHWQFGDGNTDSTKTTSHVYPAAGIYTVLLEVTGSNGCKASDSLQTHVYPLPVAAFTTGINCSEHPVQFSDASTANSVNWSWDFGDGNSSSAQHPTHTYAGGTAFNVTLIVESDSGCVDTVANIITIHPLPQPDFVSDTVCFGNQTSFTDQSSIVSGAVQQYNWQFGEGGTSGDNEPKYIYTQAGQFMAQLIAISDFGCIDSISHPVKIYMLPEAEFIADITEGCQPLEVNFTDLSDPNEGSIDTWNWDFGNGNSSSQKDPQELFEEVGLFDVSLTVVTDLNCSDSILKPAYIHVHQKPIAGFDYEPSPVEILQPVVQFDDMSMHAAQWFYDLGDNATSTQNEPSHQYETGIYNVMQVVTTAFGCTDTAFRTIEVKDAFTLYIPNAFTPNNDGKNDVFYAYGSGITEFNILIFNRWGQPVFESDAMEKGWDGGVNEKQTKEDVYFYVAKVTDVFDKQHTVNGKVTVVY